MDSDKLVENFNEAAHNSQISNRSIDKRSNLGFEQRNKNPTESEDEQSVSNNAMQVDKATSFSSMSEKSLSVNSTDDLSSAGSLQDSARNNLLENNARTQEVSIEYKDKISATNLIGSTAKNPQSSYTDERILKVECIEVFVAADCVTNPTVPFPSVESRSSQEVSHHNESMNIEQDNISNGLDKTDICIKNTSEMHLPDVNVTPKMNNDKLSNAGLTTIVGKEKETEKGLLDEDILQGVLLHRGQPIVAYSDDDNDADDSSSSSSSYVPPIENRLKEFDDMISDEETEKKQTSTKPNMQKNRIRTEGEIFPEELPPLEYLMISPDESVEVEPLGVVSGIVGVLVVVKADNNSPALYDDTILFVEGRKPLGLIFETFGTVERPYYSVRFNNAADITEKGIEVGHRVYFAPKADNLTKYVFIAELRKVKCDDASWKNDNEVPAAHRDYSDDEEERKEKRRAKNKERGITDNGSNEENPLQRKKKKWPGQDVVRDTDPSKPSLLPGELMRNPFGAKGQRFSAKPTNQWPPSHPTSHNGSGGPRVRGPLSGPPPPPAPYMFHAPPPRTGPPVASFGQNPRWTPPPNALLFPHLPPPTTPNHPPSVGQSPFTNTSQPSFASFSQPPFTGSHKPTFSSPCPPPFQLSKDKSIQFSQSFPTQFPPPPPPNFFGPRPATFNPTVPPPPSFGSKSPLVFPASDPGRPPPSNNF
ncbi:hypothetical protein RRG08_049315 [Elysia crispata]|uniref:H/ACA ribonucleoprotein complex non-core subunit NAF1 n=1 Tax=Elysia crispata TaxID=231223 RepID=A0AAE1B0C9_9GAST|nr:hypothetical protein RRG08_049315 [Elysia crispata]